MYDFSTFLPIEYISYNIVNELSRCQCYFLDPLQIYVLFFYLQKIAQKN